MRPQNIVCERSWRWKDCVCAIYCDGRQPALAFHFERVLGWRGCNYAIRTSAVLCSDRDGIQTHVRFVIALPTYSVAHTQIVSDSADPSICGTDRIYVNLCAAGQALREVRECV